MKNFGIIGVGGYIAQRHLKAIKETNNNLSVSVDVNDSVGIIDQYFPQSEFFLNTDKFIEYINAGKAGGNSLDYLAICTPNYLHKTHINLALKNGADAICEKPVVLDPRELDELAELEKETGKKIYTVLQLRHHTKLSECRNKLLNEKGKGRKSVLLTYITGRGSWYQSSWKGNKEKSGGISTNIGIHLFDLLIWLFGSVRRSDVYLSTGKQVSGFLELENADVKWFLSIDFDDIPDGLKGKKNTFRSILIDNNELEFSEGFTDLHTVVYKNILEGNGIGIEAARPSIELVHLINSQKINIDYDKLHPLAGQIIKKRAK